jgi:hypothetical protein
VRHHQGPVAVIPAKAGIHETANASQSHQRST